MRLSANSNLELPTYFSQVDMNKKTSLTLLCLTFTLLLSACAGSRLMQAPDTARGDYLKSEYMVGNWCTDAERTATKNLEEGQSAGAGSKLSELYWNFKEGGSWQVSSSGWLYEGEGKWGLKAGARQTLVLQRENEDPFQYQASFKNGSMYLEEKEGRFLVLSECE
jgi:hypothetical protein